MFDNDRHLQSSSLVRIAELELTQHSYNFSAQPGVDIPARFQNRVAFILHPQGTLAVRYGEGGPQALLDTHNQSALLAFLTFGDHGGENEYAMVIADGKLGLAAMFHVALGINEPPIITKAIAGGI